MTWGEWLVRAYCRGSHYRGKIHIARWLGARLLPADGGLYTLSSGIRMRLHPRDWVEYRLLQRGSYEPLTLSFLSQNLSAGQQAVLAGVNIGLHVIVAAQAVGPTGRVLGVEPQPASLLRAHQNITLNGLSNVLLVAAGLGHEAGLLPMAPAPLHNSGMASLVGPTTDAPFHVVIETLPELLYRLKLKRPDLMLLDVEGWEAMVLKGITASARPRLLVVEVKSDHQGKAGKSTAFLFQVLTEMGYQLFDLYGSVASPESELAEYNVVAVAQGTPAPVWVGRKGA